MSLKDEDFNVAKNPLHDFVSYSYHHILILCQNSVVADNLTAKSEDLTLFSKDDTQDYQIKTIEGGSYVTLINGLTDSEFVINSLNYQNILDGISIDTESTKPVAKNNGATLEGSLEVKEPNGIRFLNVIINIMGEMGAVEFTSLPVLIKTVFVGYDKNGTKILSHYPPFSGAFLDCTALYDETGGLYTFKLLGLLNGVANIGQYGQATSNINLLLKPTFAETIQSLENEINNKIETFIKINQSNIDTKASMEVGDTQSFVGKPVKYKIIVDEPYALNFSGLDEELSKNIQVYNTYTPNTLYKMSQVDDKLKDQGVLDSVGRVNLSFNDVYGSIMKLTTLCDKIRAELNEGVRENGENRYYEPRIINDTRIFNDKNVVIFKIIRFQRPVQKIDPTSSNKTILTDVKGGNVLQFDYLFTGKNVDVISFDMQVNSGLTLFQLKSTTSNTGPTTTGAVASTPIASNSLATSQSIKNATILPPVFNFDHHRNIVEDKQNYIAFLDNMAQITSYTQGMITVKISGNPDFLFSNTMHTSSNSKDDIDKPLTNFYTAPTIVKMNIKMPNPYLRRRKTTEDIPPFIDFWYREPYKIISLETNFDNGEFTNTLTMLPLNFDNSGNLVLGTEQLGSPPSTSGSVINPNVPSKLTAEQKLQKAQDFIKYLKSIFEGERDNNRLIDKLTIAKAIFFGGFVPQKLVVQTYSTLLEELAKSSEDKAEIRFIKDAARFNRTNFYQVFSERDKSQIISIFIKYNVIDQSEFDLINPTTNAIRLVLPESKNIQGQTVYRYILGGLINRREAEAILFSTP